MPGLRTFFRHCPSCGRRFEVRVVAKEELDSSEVDRDSPHTTSSYVPYLAASTNPRAALSMSTGSPVVVSAREADWTKFMRYEYKCKHCGHQWFEDRTETDSGRPDRSYTGD